MAELTGYNLTKNWFAFAFENNSKVRPIHGCLYLWLVELNNRRGWAAEFQAPAAECLLACGIANYRTYKTALDDLIAWGFVEMRLASKNQYTSNVIALVKNAKADTKAIDKALSEQLPKHVQSTDSIIKQETYKQETGNAPSLSVITDGERQFAEFWKAYGKPVDENPCKHEWFAMTPEERNLALIRAPLYAASEPDAQFRKNPQKWLNLKCWNNPIINKSPPKEEKREKPSPIKTVSAADIAAKYGRK